MTKDPLSSIVAVNIRRRRKALKMSLPALAERADLSDDFLGHLERGAKSPSLETLGKLANGLGVGPEDLLRKSGGPELPGSASGRLQAYLRGLTESQKADVLAILTKLKRAERVHAMRVALGA